MDLKVTLLGVLPATEVAAVADAFMYGLRVLLQRGAGHGSVVAQLTLVSLLLLVLTRVDILHVFPQT